MNIFVPKTYRPKWKRRPEEPIRPHPIPSQYVPFNEWMERLMNLRWSPMRSEIKHIKLPLGASIREG